MKIIHLSDLHLGKRVNEMSMLEDQEYILIKIINVIDEEKPDAICIAGDVFDRSMPSEEALLLWDDFLARLVERSIPVYVSSGNHDSAVRLADHNRLIAGAGVYISSAYNGTVEKYTVEDDFGPVNIYMLPFVKPVIVKSFLKEAEIDSYTDACRVALEQVQVDTKERNVILAHQFVTSAQRCDSEEIVVGGIDNVDASVFDDFDYVALGHIHGPQSVTRDTIRYCGTPLKYSFSEKNHKKSVTVVELGEKGSIDIRTVELVPRRDMREIRGLFEDIIKKENYENTNTDDYVRVILEDENDIYDAINKLRVIYPNIMLLDYDNKRTRQNQSVEIGEVSVEKQPMDYLGDLYIDMNNQPMSEEQLRLATDIFTEIMEG